MKTLITSCGRFDLLEETISSLIKDQKSELEIYINEDTPFDGGQFKPTFLNEHQTSYTNGLGQHNSIQLFLEGYDGRNQYLTRQKYYLHCEDDWHFNNSYDWIQASIDIMEADPTIIKVLCNSDSPHPCEYDKTLIDFNMGFIGQNGQLFYTSPVKKIVSGARNFDADGSGLKTCDNFGYLEPWTNDGITWHGFSWNPGVTRLDLLKQFVPFGKHEQDVAKAIYDAGYKVVRLENGVCHHIGQGRSTHE